MSCRAAEDLSLIGFGGIGASSAGATPASWFLATRSRYSSLDFILSLRKSGSWSITRFERFSYRRDWSIAVPVQNDRTRVCGLWGRRFTITQLRILILLRCSV